MKNFQKISSILNDTPFSDLRWIPRALVKLMLTHVELCCPTLVLSCTWNSSRMGHLSVSMLENSSAPSNYVIGQVHENPFWTVSLFPSFLKLYTGFHRFQTAQQNLCCWQNTKCCHSQSWIAATLLEALLLIIVITLFWIPDSLAVFIRGLKYFNCFTYLGN